MVYCLLNRLFLSLSCAFGSAAALHCTVCLHSTLHLLLSPSPPSLFSLPRAAKNARAHTDPSRRRRRERERGGQAELTGGGGELEKKEGGWPGRRRCSSSS